MARKGLSSLLLAKPSREFLVSIWLFLVALGYVAGGILTLPPRFIVNDDIINRNFIIGGYPLDYVGVFFSGFLHRMYVLQPVIPWYALSLYALHIISVSIWLMLIWRTFRRWWLALPFIIAFLGFYLFFIINLDYTSVSEMLCLSSLAWACFYVLERPPGYLRYLGLGILFMLGMLARPQGVIGAFASVSPVALLIGTFSLHKYPPKQELTRLALIVVVFLIPASLNLAADTAYRHYTLTPQQAAYDAFNRPRGVLHGLSKERQQAIVDNAALLRSVRWSRRDAENFFGWKFLDERIFTPESVQTLVDNEPLPANPLEAIANRIARLFSYAFHFILLLTCSLPLFYLALRRHLWLAGWGLLLPLIYVLFDALLATFLTFTTRTELPFLACDGFLILCLGGYLATREGMQMGKLQMSGMSLAVLLAFTGTYFSLDFTGKVHEGVTQQSEVTRHQLNVLNHDYPGSYVLLMPTLGVQLESLNPLAYTPLYFHPIDMVWDTFSPYFYSQISPLGIQHGYELIDALVDNKHAYFVGTPWEAKVLLNAYGDRSKGDLKAIQLQDFGRKNICLFRFVTERKPKHI